MKILIAGANGTIGRHLVPVLEASGHEIERLTRPDSSARSDRVWVPERGVLDPWLVAGFDVIASFNGAPLTGSRSTLMPSPNGLSEAAATSRVDAVRLLAEAICASSEQPRLFVTASGSRFYGDCGDRFVDERDPVGVGVLPRLFSAWEAAASTVRERGVRHIPLRLPPLLHLGAGTLPALRAAVMAGAPIVGAGSRYVGWATLDDGIRAVAHLLESGHDGPANICAPNPVRFRDVVGALAAAMDAEPVPIEPGAGDADAVTHELRTMSTRVRSGVLGPLGFEFAETQISSAIMSMFGRGSATEP